MILDQEFELTGDECSEALLNRGYSWQFVAGVLYEAQVQGSFVGLDLEVYYDPTEALYAYTIRSL